MKQNEIERLLPDVFRRTLRPKSVLSGILQVMEALHEPSEEMLARIDSIFNPYRTPDRFIAYCARWVDLDRFFPPRFANRLQPHEATPLSTGLGRLRELIAKAAHLSRWRGTTAGLRLFLETATGSRGFELDEHVRGPDGQPRPFHVRITAPAETAVHRSLIERIIEQEKPAHVTYELVFGPAGRGGD